MNKWIKRVTVFVVGLAVVLGLAAGGAYVYGVRAKPEWLKRPTFTAAEQAEAANRLDRKLMETLSKVREMDADDAPSDDAASQPAGDNDRRPAATQPATKLAVSFTEEELNAWFHKWDRLYGWSDRFKAQVQEPSVVLHDGRIVLAGNSKELGTVVSVHFEPMVAKKGELLLHLSHVLAGRLPVPGAFTAKYRTAARNKLEAALPALQKEAAFRPDGSANGEAMSAAMAKLFLHMLAEEPGEPVLFLPVGNKRSVPVKLTDVKVEDKALSMVVKRLNARERADVLKRIREPLNDNTALNAADRDGANAAAAGGDPARSDRGS